MQFCDSWLLWYSTCARFANSPAEAEPQLERWYPQAPSAVLLLLYNTRVRFANSPAKAEPQLERWCPPASGLYLLLTVVVV